MARRIIWLLLILQALSLASCETRAFEEDAKTTAVDEAKTATKTPLPFGDVIPDGSNGGQTRQPGADDFDAAMTELRRISPSPHHRRKSKTSGFLGTLWYVVMKAAPSLRLSGPAPSGHGSSTSSSPRPAASMSAGLARAVGHLEQAAAANNSDGLFALAELAFFGNYSFPRDLARSFGLYRALAALDGNATAAHMVGLMYSTGVGGAVARDQARALLFYTFAASRGNTRAEMTLASRHHAGVGTPKSCDKAVRYYKRVADKAVAWHRSGPPGGMAWVQEAHRLADEEGGVYGQGASASSSGINAMRGSVQSDQYSSIEDIIEYLDLMSIKGDFKASFNLGKLYYEGQRGVDRNFGLAMRYFLTVVKLYWKGNNRVTDHPKPELAKTAGRAAGYLGRMFLRGDGVETDFVKAKKWFDRGKQHGDAQSQWGLGTMMLHGLGYPRNVQLATEFFKAASDQDYAPAQVEMGVLHLDQGGSDDLKIANNYFELAARFGNIEAYYYLGELTHHGVGRDKSCGMALSYYKSVAEKVEPLSSTWQEANRAYYDDGDSELALLLYVMAAEQGYERAQNNVAYLLDPTRSRSALPRWLTDLALLPGPAPWLVQRVGLLGGGKAKEKGSQMLSPPPPAPSPPPILDNPELALIYWTRSSRQSNIDSLVKMGDYYLGGIGTEPDVDKAAQCYTGASEYHQSAQALFNLGWMHENGVGLTQDFHLAKRYYDQALETNDEAYLPVTLGLLKLRARSAWNTFTHGRINSIQDEPETSKDWSLTEWIANFMHDDPHGDMAYGGGGAANGAHPDDPLIPFDQDDVEGAAVAAGGGAGGALDQAFADDLDDLVFEGLVFGALIAMLVVLVLYRQQRVQAHRRGRQGQDGEVGGDDPAAGGAQIEDDEVAMVAAGQRQDAVVGVQQTAEREGQEAARRRAAGGAAEGEEDDEERQDRGVFPRDGADEMPAWLAGGVGH